MSKRLLLLPCLVIFSAFALAACGSSGEETSEIKGVIETSATTSDSADCKRLETQQFMEQLAQETGEGAVKECEEEAENEEGVDAIAVSNVEVDGSDATAEATLTGGGLDGQTVEVALVKDGDQWKVNEIVKFADFDRASLVEGFEGEFSSEPGKLAPKITACFIEAFEEGSQADVEELILSGSPEGLEEVAEACQ